MADFERTTNVKEEYSSRGIMALAPGLILLLIGIVMFIYQRSQGGVLVALSVVLMVMAVGLICYSGVEFAKIKKVTTADVKCPFCEATNTFTSSPNEDFRCMECNREVHVEPDGRILEVFQVRCGFCNHLNFYSERSTGLICEECDRVIPIATDQENKSEKIFDAYTVHDDDHPYDLILTSAPNSEEMVSCLQKMLALNRNQVKEILEELPVTLLTGIPKKKAELLAAQIASYDGQADTPMSEG